MLENLLVALIVIASAWYAGRKYLPVKAGGNSDSSAGGGCGSGCGACQSGCDTPAQSDQMPERRVIPIRRG